MPIVGCPSCQAPDRSGDRRRVVWTGGVFESRACPVLALLVLQVVSHRLSVTCAAAQYGLSRRHLHRLLARYRTGGLEAVDRWNHTVIRRSRSTGGHASRYCGRRRRPRQPASRIPHLPRPPSTRREQRRSSTMRLPDPRERSVAGFEARGNLRLCWHSCAEGSSGWPRRRASTHLWTFGAWHPISRPVGWRRQSASVHLCIGARDHKGRLRDYRRTAEHFRGDCFRS
jgi:hypothetical protein